MSTPPGPGYPPPGEPLYGGYRPMGAPQTGGTLAVRRPIEVNASFVVWLVGAGVTVAWMILRLVDLQDVADRAATDVGVAFALKWGYIFLGIWAACTAAFVLFAFMIRAGQHWARITLTALTVLIALLLINASEPLAFVAVGCAVLGCVLFFLPNSNAYFKLKQTS